MVSWRQALKPRHSPPSPEGTCEGAEVDARMSCHPDQTRTDLPGPDVLRFPHLRNISQDLSQDINRPKGKAFPSASRGHKRPTQPYYVGHCRGCVIHTEITGGKQKIEPRSLSHEA